MKVVQIVLCAHRLGVTDVVNRVFEQITKPFTWFLGALPVLTRGELVQAHVDHGHLLTQGGGLGGAKGADECTHWGIQNELCIIKTCRICAVQGLIQSGLIHPIFAISMTQQRLAHSTRDTMCVNVPIPMIRLIVISKGEALPEGGREVCQQSKNCQKEKNSHGFFWCSALGSEGGGGGRERKAQKLRGGFLSLLCWSLFLFFFAFFSGRGLFLSCSTTGGNIVGYLKIVDNEF